ncbi:MAG: Heimdall-CTERM domain-containing surface protein [Candidatus Hodarchaeales archaeon]
MRIINKIQHFIVLGIFLMMLTTLVAGESVTAVLSDNFDDGNYDGWTIIGHDWTSWPGSFKTWVGNASVVNGELWMNGSAPYLFTLAEYPTTVTHGSWSFDMFTTQIARVAFVSDISVATFDPENGTGSNTYYLTINGNYLILEKSEQSLETDLALKYISGISGHWQHIEITRDMSNQILVYINGTLQINATDYNNPHTTSVSFKFNTESYARFDNITVSEFVDSTTTTTTTTTATTTTTTKTTTTDSTNTPGFEIIPPLLSVFILLTVFRRKRK